MKNNIALGLSIVAIIVALASVGLVGGKQSAPSAGAIAGITNYDGLQAVALAVGATPSSTLAEAVVNSAGTSTIALTGGPSCIQFVSSTGSTSKLYITGSGATTTSIVTAVGTCK